MQPKLLLRIAAFCIFFVAVGHTTGNITRKQTTDAHQQEVFKKMEDVKFDFFGSVRSWDNLYNGLSIDVSITLVVFTVLLWKISTAATQYPEFCIKLLWAILVFMILFTITGFIYFFWVPAVSTLLAGVFIAIAMFQLKKSFNTVQQ